MLAADPLVEQGDVGGGIAPDQRLFLREGVLGALEVAGQDHQDGLGRFLAALGVGHRPPESLRYRRGFRPP
jgi:hypothetical protein